MIHVTASALLALAAASPQAEMLTCRISNGAEGARERPVTVKVTKLPDAGSGRDGHCEQRSKSVYLDVGAMRVDDSGDEVLAEPDGVVKWVMEKTRGEATLVDAKAIRFAGQKAALFRFRGPGVGRLLRMGDSELVMVRVRRGDHHVLALAAYPAADAKTWLPRLRAAIESSEVSIHDSGDAGVTAP